MPLDLATEIQQWVDQRIARTLRLAGIVGGKINLGSGSGQVPGGAIPYASPTGYVGGSASTGTANTALRSDAVIPHGTIATGDLHQNYVLESREGVANGIATLDAGTLVPVAQLGSGTPTGSKYLRDDRTWQIVTGGAALTIMEADGSPSVGTVNTIKFDGGTVTDDGGGTVTVSTGGGSANPGEGHVTILPSSYNSVGQGTWNLNASSSSYGAFFLRNDSPANGDNVSFKVYLAAGTYTLLVVYHKATTAGITDVYLDASVVVTIDMYGTTAWNQRSLTTGISVASSGLKTLKLNINGKNASATTPYYYCVVAYMALWRTA